MINRNFHILVVAGELSSDNHGAKLIREFKNIAGVKVTAVGGSRMAAVADMMEENIVSKAAIGFVEVLRFIPFFIGLKNRIVERYFDKKIPIIKSPQVLVIENVKDYNGNKEEFVVKTLEKR